MILADYTSALPPTADLHREEGVVRGAPRTGKKNLNRRPPAEADAPGVRNITGSSGAPVGRRCAFLVHRVDAVLTGCVPTGEKKLELQPPAEADDHGVR